MRLNQRNLSTQDQKIFDAFVKKFNLSGSQINEYLNKWTQRELQLLDEEYLMNDPIEVDGEIDLDSYFGDDDLITDIFRDVRTHYLTKNSVKVSNLQFSAAELILGDLYKSSFNREDADSMYKIQTQGAKYFKDKLAKDFEHDDTKADIKLTVSTSEEPVYIRYVTEFDGYDTSVNIKIDHEASTDQTVYSKYNSRGIPMYSIHNLDDVRVVNEDGKEIILVKAGVSANIGESNEVWEKNENFETNLSQLLRSFKGTITTFAPIMNGIITKPLKSKAKDDSIVSTDVHSVTMREFSKETGFRRADFGKLNSSWMENNMESITTQLSTKKYASWQKSQEFVAARIPSQSMQSFMPMKNVAYYKTSQNDAFVSIYQIWLQGSDFDIDKAYILGSGFNKNGQFDT